MKVKYFANINGLLESYMQNNECGFPWRVSRLPPLRNEKNGKKHRNAGQNVNFVNCCETKGSTVILMYVRC